MQGSGRGRSVEYNLGWTRETVIASFFLNSLGTCVDRYCVKDANDIRDSGVIAPNIFCRACVSPLVQAVDWTQVEDSSWHIRLWCPECGFEQTATLDRSQLLYLSLAIEEGFVWMLDALSELHTLSKEPMDIDFAHKAQTDRIPSIDR